MRGRFVIGHSIVACCLLLVCTLLIPAVSEAEGTERSQVVVKTNKGTFRIKLFPDKAPITVTNFILLVESGFYDGLTFHRYVPGFVIQGGDPKGDGTGGPGYTIKDEHENGLKHYKGAVAMAKTAEPNSAGSQFYICLTSIHELDDKYTVFGQVVEGMDVVLKLRRGDIMERVRTER